MDAASLTDVFWLALTQLMLIVPAKPLELLAVEVPGWVELGTRPALTCRWQLGPADVLYSVKWYKDGKEFFRHVPRDAEPRRRFPLPGVDVEDSDSCGSQVVLSPARLATRGRYRCEVSGERPLFVTVSHHADMDVVALPEHGPIISGFLPKYRLRDRVGSNCTSGHSQPATQLSWYINGEPLPVGEYSTSYRSDNALIVTTLTLDFEVTEEHFRKSMLKLKCLAIITPIYWKSNEETAVLEKTGDRNVKIIPKHKTFKRVDRSHVNLANATFLHFSFSCLLLFGVFTVKLFTNILCS